MNITNRMPIGMPYSPPGCEIELSEEEQKTVQKIHTIAQKITRELALQPMQLRITPTFIRPSFSSMFYFLGIPTCCFSKATRDQIDQIALKYFKWMKIDLKSLEETALSERELTLSYTDDELAFMIGHEIGHHWLHENFKAFESLSLQVDGSPVTQLVHDRALERICDFIGAKFSSAKAGASAMQKIGTSTPPEHLVEENSHPHPFVRVEYISQWQNDPRLGKEMNKELAIEIGGDPFRESVPIYEKYGK